MRKTLIAGMLLAAGAGTLVAAQPKPKSQKEVEALQAMFQAATPDARIAAADNVVTKFADSDFKPLALYMEAFSYQQKGDYEKTVVFGERALEADPKSYDSMLLLANVIAQKTRDTDLDKEEKLTRAEKYAKSALETIPTAEKPNPAIPDDKWAEEKNNASAQAHQALGMIAMVRKKPDVAVAELKQAAELAPNDPGAAVRLADAYNQAGKYDDAIAGADKLLAQPNLHPAVKTLSEQIKAKATAAKNRGGAQPSASAPAQVEIKK